VNNKQKVLIIDDEADFCFVFKSYLLKKGCEAYVANSLDSGIKMMELLQPDVVFLDNNLPDGFGWEKLEFIHKTYPFTKVNLISAYQQKLEEIPDSHVNVWEKPLDMGLLDSYFQQQFVA